MPIGAPKAPDCSIQKSDVLCFHQHSGFVPDIFEFSRGPPGFPQASDFGPCRIPDDPVPRQNVRDVNKLEFWLYFTHLNTQLGFVLARF